MVSVPAFGWVGALVCFEVVAVDRPLCGPGERCCWWDVRLWGRTEHDQRPRVNERCCWRWWDEGWRWFSDDGDGSVVVESVVVNRM